MPSNPFTSWGAIRDPRFFYGRTAELRRIFDSLRAEPPQSIQIIGDGKTGKTSFLNYLLDPGVRKANELDSEKEIFIYFSFQSNPLIKQQKFWKGIFEKISRQIIDLQIKQQLDHYINLDQILMDHVQDLFRFLKNNDYQIFLLIDEFQVVKDNPDLFNEEFFTNLRYLNTRYNLAFVVATEENIYTLIPENYGSPFPNTFGSIFLNVFTEQDVHDFIQQTKRTIELSLETEFDFILRQAGGHPFLTQVVSYWVFDAKSQKGSLDNDDLETVRENSIDQVSKFFQSIWPTLTDRMQKVLLDVAWKRPVDEVAYRDVIRRLVRHKKYLSKKGSEYSIFSQLFLRFLREKKSDGADENRFFRQIKNRPRLEYDDFEIDIEEIFNEKGYPVRVLDSGAGEAKTYSIFELDLIKEDLSDISEQNTDLSFLKKFGSRLKEFLLVGSVQRRFDNALGRSLEAQRGLRVRLRIDPPEISSLPWEFIYEPEGGHWFATSNSVTFSRYVETDLPQPDLEVRLPLNILLILSNPVDITEYNLPILELDKERDHILKVLNDLVELGLITIDTIDRPTVTAIRRRLQSPSKQYHIVHFCGHGIFSHEEAEFSCPIPLEKNLGYLIFEKANELAHPVHQDTLIELFKDTGLSLLVINACQSATSSPTQQFSGLANGLVRAGLPAVIAMQYDILDEIARLFAFEFYAALANGQPVDVCIAEARRAIAIDYDQANRDWASPVLFMRSKDGVIFNILKE